MTMWLRRTATAGFKVAPFNCEREPAPTIMAGWIAGGNLSQYYLEDDGVTRPAAKSDKPPYRVPTMAEIRKLPWNGCTVASTFAGGGGSSLGYRMAGFRVVYANEFVEAARETYRENADPRTVIDGRDIREVTAEDILARVGMKPGELDIFDGSPPCASFSLAGKRERHWGKEKSYSDRVQRTDDLFHEYARLLKGLQPKVFVAENVKGLLLGTAVGYFREIHAALEACGYRVEARLLNAKWLGVPQSRERTIFVGVRSDLGMAPVFPKPWPYFYTMLDAIPWLRRPSKPGDVEPETDIARFAVGRQWSRTRLGEYNDKYKQLYRSHPDRPSCTISAEHGAPSIAGATHPFEKRKFSIAEVKRLCSFPDDWVVTGSYNKQWERMGRAVPPVMMRAIAETVRDEILGKLHAARSDGGQAKPDRRPRAVRA